MNIFSFRIGILFITLIGALNLFSCKSNQSIRIDTKTQFLFPDDWLGEWRGELSIWNQGKKSMTVPMVVRNFPTIHSDTLEWALIYGEDEVKGLRAYYLIIDTLQDNHFVVDERNSIFLDGYVHDNVYVSNFNVMGNEITSVYKLLNKDQMSFEIFFNKDEPISTSGNTVNGSDTIPEVSSFPVLTYQRAYLKKVRD